MKKIKLTLFVTVLTAALFGVGCASVKITKEQLQNGMVAYYPFNGNAMDGSGNGNHGEVKGATLTTDRNGAADKAYSFDGVDDYIKVASNHGLKGVKRSHYRFGLRSSKKSCPVMKDGYLPSTGGKVTTIMPT